MNQLLGVSNWEQTGVGAEEEGGRGGEQRLRQQGLGPGLVRMRGEVRVSSGPGEALTVCGGSGFC